MPSFSFLVVLLLSLLVGGVVQVNGSSEKKKMENYWWSSSSHLPNGAAQKRWKRDDGAILKEVSSSTMGGSSDDVTQINFQDSKSKQNFHVTFKVSIHSERGFGKKANRIPLCGYVFPSLNWHKGLSIDFQSPRDDSLFVRSRSGDRLFKVLPIQLLSNVPFRLCSIVYRNRHFVLFR